MRRLAAVVLAVAAVSACTSEHHADPLLIPAGSTGAAALGQPVDDLDAVIRWVQKTTDECDDAEPADDEQLREYLGPTRYHWYRPHIAAWATCGVRPYDRIGLVVFARDGQTALQKSWVAALRGGDKRGNPDWAFGNGFAITAGPLGVERLGLRYLVCEPGQAPGDATVPSDVDGCVFAAGEPHHE